MDIQKDLQIKKKAISILTALIPELKFNKTEPIYFTYKNKNKKKNQKKLFITVKMVINQKKLNVLKQ